MSVATTNTEIGPYRLGSLLGEGAMGRVYAGEKPGQGPIALKVPIAPEFESMLEAEAHALQQVSHPNIVPFVDWVAYNGSHALVMGYVDGESLEERFAQRPLSHDEMHGMATKIADALASAHRSGVVHRDLKPSNIKMRPDGEPVLLDFGAAVSLDTGEADPVGTLSYMSPEQVLGEPASPASDQFSFGVVLYEAIAGRRPFSGYHAAALEYEICHEHPPLLHELDNAIPEPLSRIVEKLLAKQATGRFPSLEAFLVEWEQVQEAEAGTGARTRLVVAAATFENETGDSTVDFIGRAVQHQIVSGLRSLSGLVLVDSKTVAAQEKAQADKLKAAAMVGAGYSLSGHYLVLGDQMQITTVVTAVESGEQVFSGQFRGTRDGLFTLQDTIATEVGTFFRTLLPEQKVAEEKTGPAPGAYKLYREARELYLQGGRDNLEQAFEKCEEAIEIDEKFSVAQACLADCYINMYMWRIDPRTVWLDRGERAAQKALRMDPETAAAYRSLGRVAQHRREREQAIEHFQKAIEIDLKYHEAMCSLSWVFSEMRKFDLALYWASEALKANPGSDEAMLLRGLAYLDERNYGNAERAFRELVRLHPEYARGHLYLGETLQKEGRFAEARDAYQAATQCENFNPESYRDLGCLEIFLKDLGAARATFMRMIEKEIFEFVAHYYLGVISRLEGDSTGAVISWQSSRLLAERLVTKDPQDQYARVFLGMAKAALGDRSGYEPIQEVRREEPDSGEMAYYEARAAQMLGDLDQAEACVFEATQLPTGPSHSECSADPHFTIDWTEQTTS